MIGGTWSVYPREYQEDFIRNIYDAHTTFSHLRPFIEGTFWDEEVGDIPEKEEKIKKQFAKFQLKK